MREEGIENINAVGLSEDSPTAPPMVSSNNSLKIQKKTSVEPVNQLSNGLLGWYALCSSTSLKEGELNHISMFNEPLILYRDKESQARCIKDLCPHRGASFYGGEISNGELVCPYHGARFSSIGECTNIDRITCQHIIDSNYDNYAKKIHLNQYPCIEKDGYIYVYYNGSAKTNINDFDIKTSVLDLVPNSYGFKTEDYTYEEVSVDFKCDWSKIIENHLDILHIFWVHGNTIPDKDVNRNIITSFKQEIKRDKRNIESKYLHRDHQKGEFISIKFVPPGRILIYKGSPDTARYIQVLDHIPLADNRARVIVRHYRKFMKNKFLTKLVLFKQLQHRIFYKIFSEDYMILKTQTFNQQMGYVEKNNVKLLGEDKMIQYYWDWLQNALLKEKPWDLHTIKSNTNKVHEEIPMKYPPENRELDKANNRSIIFQLILRALIPIGLIIVLL